MVWALYLDPPYRHSEKGTLNFISVLPVMAQCQKLNPWIINSDRGKMPDSETGVKKI